LLGSFGFSLCRSGLLQKATAPLFAEAVAVAPDGDDVAVVEQPVEDRCGDDWIAQDLAPFANRAVGRDEHASAFVPAAHKLKEQMRGVRLEGQVTEFVHDQELRLREEGQPLLKYRTYEDIVEACCEAWNYLMDRPNEIASIATRSWAKAS
jgi:hypothetical protein